LRGKDGFGHAIDLAGRAGDRPGPSCGPCRSKMPAERSPAARTVVEKAVRIMICACSSTTAIRRWICARALVSRDMGNLSGIAAGRSKRDFVT